MTVAEMPPSLESGTRSIAALAEQAPGPRIDGAWKSFDAGTAILKVRDLTDTLGGTMLIAVAYEGLQPDVRRATAPRMARIRWAFRPRQCAIGVRESHRIAPNWRRS
jgi:hypothetical protein